MPPNDLDRVIELGKNNMTVRELRERVTAVEPSIVILEEVDGQTVEGAEITLGRITELVRDVGPFAIIVDLQRVPSRPASDYRECMERWARTMPPFHTAYVLPPVGAITRMALRWVALRVLKVHEDSTSSDHESIEDAVAKCREVLSTAAREAQ